MATSSLDLAGGPYTDADLERLPEDERIHYEISYGTLVVTPDPTVRHQHVLGDLVAFLKLPTAGWFRGPSGSRSAPHRSERYSEIQPDPGGRIVISVPVAATVDPAAFAGRATAY